MVWSLSFLCVVITDFKIGFGCCSISISYDHCGSWPLSSFSCQLCLASIAHFGRHKLFKLLGSAYNQLTIVKYLFLIVFKIPECFSSYIVHLNFIAP